MNKKFKLVLFLLTVGQCALYAQQKGHAHEAEKMNRIVDEWFNGEVTFRNGETIFCRLSYNPLLPEGIVRIDAENKTLTGTVKEIDSFSYYDYNTSTDYIYYSWYIDNHHPMFAELLYEDEHYAILGKKRADFKKKYVGGVGSMMGSYSGLLQTTAHPMAYQTTKVTVVYEKLVLDIHSGTLSEIGPREWEWVAKEYRQQMKHFVRKNNVNVREVEGCIAAVRQYKKLTR